MDGEDTEPRDLDLADLDEVRRRVVDPVLAAMFAPGELSFVHLSFDHPPRRSWSAFGGSDDGAWLQLRVGTEEFIHPIGKTGFWLDEINWVAGDLADKLAEWICESSFGWGEWRSLPDDWIPPAPRPGRHVVSVHIADDGGLPLWAGEAQATWLASRLSSGLVADLLAWQTLGERLAEDADEAPAADIPETIGPYASWVEYLTEHQVLAREADQRRTAAEARVARREWIDALEPLRDELVERLRAELGPDYEVRTPPRVQ